MQVSIKELRTRVREIFDCLDRGEPVTLTYRGKPRAKLVRVDENDKADPAEPDATPAFGMWSDREELDDVAAHVRELRRGRSGADRY